jgi:putative Holliday junction resolvase
MGRVLGLDVGERRIGVAISTPEGRLAVPLRIIQRSVEAEDARALRELARAEGADLLVIGHPLSLDGTAGPQAKLIEAFAERLGRATGLRVELWDERLTTAQARRSPAGAKRGRAAGRRSRALDDDVAAAIILQSYLDRQRETA